jgi:Putative peptidoglycan binding domain
MIVPGQQLVVPQGGSLPSGSLPSRSAQVTASCQAPDSEEADGTPIVFAPENVLDGNPETVWRCEASVADQSLTFTLDGPTQFTSVGLIGGYVKVDPLTEVDRFPQNHRVRQVRWTFDDGTTVIQDLADSRKMQSIAVDVTASSMTMTITATYPPGGDDPRDTVPVAEVQWTVDAESSSAASNTTTSSTTTGPTTTGPECQFTENDELPIHRCDAGPAVAAAQSVLQVLDYEIGTVDCLFGDQMMYAVQAFQTDRGLVANGEIDEATWNALSESFLPDWGTDVNGNGVIDPDEITLDCG